MADADEDAAVGELHQFGFVAAAIGAGRDVPCVAVVVAVYHEVVEGVAGLAAHGGGKHDAAGMLAAGEAQAVAGAEEGGAVVAAGGIGGLAAPQLGGDVLGR